MNKSPFCVLTEDEKEAFMNYITQYAEMPPTVPCDYLLREWDNQKQKIFELFDEKLILKYPVEFEEPTSAIASRMREEWENMPKEASSFYYKYIEFIDSKKDEFYKKAIKENLDFNVQVFYYMEEFISTATLSSNQVPYNCEIPLKKADGSERLVKIQQNSKPLRAIRRIVESYGEEEVATFEEFDAFATWVSTFHNTAKVKGNLCLSIHPLDYLTMSDNSNDWTSCMSWANEGCYRAGTIEMMNSPYAVVAYLEANDRSYMMNNNFAWNSKRWRMLALIHDKATMTVKAYPYFHESLMTFTIDKLAELTGRPYTKPAQFRPFDYWTIENYPIYIAPRTNRMYNDFGATDHYICLFTDEDVFDIEFEYSGLSECMSCGRVYTKRGAEIAFRDEESLCCRRCTSKKNIVHCDSCGKALERYIDDITFIDGKAYCRDCADRLLFTDVLTGFPNYRTSETMLRVETEVNIYPVGKISLPDFLSEGIKPEFRKNVEQWANNYEITVPVNYLSDYGRSSITWYLKFQSGMNLPKDFSLFEKEPLDVSLEDVRNFLFPHHQNIQQFDF